MLVALALNSASFSRLNTSVNGEKSKSLAVKGAKFDEEMFEWVGVVNTALGVNFLGLGQLCF